MDIENLIRRNNILVELFGNLNEIGIPSLGIYSLGDEPTPWAIPQHTRSVSWLVEAQIVHTIQSNSIPLGIERMQTPDVDDSPWDLMMSIDGETFYVDIKTFQANADRTVPGDLISIVRWNDFRQSEESDYWEQGNDTETTLNYATFEVELNGNEIRIAYDVVFPIEFISKNNGPRLWEDEFRLDFTASGTKIAAAGNFYSIQRSTEQFDDLLEFLRSDVYRELEWTPGPGVTERKRNTILRCWVEHTNASDVW